MYHDCIVQMVCILLDNIIEKTGKVHAKKSGKKCPLEKLEKCLQIQVEKVPSKSALKKLPSRLLENRMEISFRFT